MFIDVLFEFLGEEHIVAIYETEEPAPIFSLNERDIRQLHILPDRRNLYEKKKQTDETC